jgi:hypothetical protein
VGGGRGLPVVDERFLGDPALRAPDCRQAGALCAPRYEADRRRSTDAVSASQFLKAQLAAAGCETEITEVVLFVLASNDVGIRTFAEVAREDGVEPAFLPLLEHLGLPRFQALVREARTDGRESRAAASRRNDHWSMRLPRHYAPVFVAGALAACAEGGAGPGAATALAGGSIHCDPFDSIDVHGKEYVVQANEWNSKQIQCLSVNETAFAVTEANFSLPSAGPPASFPSIYKGCHWGNCTDRSGLPALVSTLPAVPSHWTVTSAASGAYDIAYDLWFNQTATASGQPNGTELMIWLDHAGGVQPAGSRIAAVLIGGAVWDVWKGPMSGWTYTAYVRQMPVDSVDLDLREFVQDALVRGTINPAWYLIDVEAGFEIWQGGSGLATRSFSAVVGGG